MSTPMPLGSDAPAAGPRTRVPRWVGVVFPLVAFGVAGMLAVSGANRVWLPIVTTIAGAAALGLLAGFAARWSLKQRSLTARWLVALGAVTVGLLGAGLVSRGGIGIGSPFPLPAEVRWVDLAQLAAGGLTAWLALRAFSITTRTAALPGQAIREIPPTRWSLADPRLVEETRPTRARRRRPAPSPPVASAPPTAARRLHLARPTTRTLRDRYRRLTARLAQAFPWRPGNFLSRRRLPPIRFTGSAEDRCPYCLDVVDPRDRRGVTSCPVCHTPHHADCWAVTGMCQMPHLYGEGHVARPGARR